MTSRIRFSILLALLAFASFSFVSGLGSSDRAVASEHTVSLHAPPTDHAPQQDAPVDAGADDERVPVQVWTVAAAVLAAAAGLLFFLVRLIMGWVKPPPPQDSQH